VKFAEVAFHLRPSRLWRVLRERDPFLRRQLRWTLTHTGAVWLGEVLEFLFRTRFARAPRPLRWWLRTPMR